MVMSQSINAVVPLLGSKRLMAAQIVEELGPHTAYWEPFCGSLPILLSKFTSSHETVNDLHGDLLNLIRVIQHQKYGPMLYRRLRRVVPHEGLFKEASQEYLQSDYMSEFPNVDRAFLYFVVSWLGRNGLSGTKSEGRSFGVRYTPVGGHNGGRFASAVSSIPAWRRRLRKVVVLCRDGIEVIKDIPDTRGIAIYVDPPYIVEGGQYKHNFGSEDKKDNLYKHFLLSQELSRFIHARVVISYYNHPFLHDLYSRSDGWAMVKASRIKNMSMQGARGSSAKEAPEVLIMNGRSLGITDINLGVV